MFSVVSPVDNPWPEGEQDCKGKTSPVAWQPKGTLVPDTESQRLGAPLAPPFANLVIMV